MRSARSPVGKRSKWMGRTSARHFASAFLSFSLSADRLSFTEARALIISYANGSGAAISALDAKWLDTFFLAKKSSVRCRSQISLLDFQSPQRRKRSDCGDRYGDGKHSGLSLGRSTGNGCSAGRTVVITRNANVHAMAKVTGIATGQLILQRNIMRPIKKKVRPKMRIIGREVNM